MYLSEMLNNVMSLSKEYPIIAAAAGLVLLFLMFRKTKLFLGLLLLALVLALTWYFISDISSTGTSKKEKMIEKGLHPGMADQP